MNKLIKYLTLAAAVAGLTGMAYATPTSTIILQTGGTTIFVQDNMGLDLNSAVGEIGISGLTIGGWYLNITGGETKPALGTSAAPEMDLGVQGHIVSGSAALTVMFSDLNFGPTNGSLASMLTTNGTSAETSKVYMDAGNTGFALTTLLNSGSLINDDSPYSLTLVDTFTAGTVSSDHRINVPDGGTTALLLGAGLTGLALISRRQRRKS